MCCSSSAISWPELKGNISQVQLCLAWREKMHLPPACSCGKLAGKGAERTRGRKWWEKVSLAHVHTLHLPKLNTNHCFAVTDSTVSAQYTWPGDVFLLPTAKESTVRSASFSEAISNSLEQMNV